MHRVLFQIGDFKVYSFGLAVLAAFLAAFFVARKRAARYGLTSANVNDAAFWTLLVGVIGARIGFIVQDLKYFLKRPAELLQWQFQGLTSFGGILFGLGYLALYARLARKPIWNVFDMISAPFLLAYAIGRIGCLLNGCCHGAPSTLPWAVAVEGRPGLYAPAQAYEMLLSLAAFGGMLLLESRPIPSGRAFAAGLMAFGAVRFVSEIWRAGWTSTFAGNLPLTDAQIVSIAAIVIGAILWRLRRRAPRLPMPEPE